MPFHCSNITPPPLVGGSCAKHQGSVGAGNLQNRCPGKKAPQSIERALPLTPIPPVSLLGRRNSIKQVPRKEAASIHRKSAPVTTSLAPRAQEFNLFSPSLPYFAPADPYRVPRSPTQATRAPSLSRLPVGALALFPLSSLQKKILKSAPFDALL